MEQEVRHGANTPFEKLPGTQITYPRLTAPAAPPVPHFPRLRALALFGRRPPQLVDSLVLPASENLHTNGHPARFPIARKRGHMASGDTWRFGARVSACTGENAREGTCWKDCVRDRCSVRHWTGDRDRLRPSGVESHALRH